MLEYFSKSIQRKFKMMRLLSCSTDYIDIKYITDFLNTNERTVQADIKEMSDSEIGNIFEIEIRSDKYKMLLKDNTSIDCFGHFLMKYNECFLILEHVFFNNHHTVEDLAEIHHCSMATLYRYINLINKGLKGKYNLKFKTNPCRLVGDEIEIRSFYIQYFTERYPASESPFIDINQGELLKLFKSFAKELGFKLQYSDLKMLELSLAVSHVRCNQGFYLEQTSPRIDNILSHLH